MWELIEEQDLKYFRLELEDKVFLYSTKIGTEKFLKKFRAVMLKQIHSEIIVDIDTDSQTIGDGLITSEDKAICVKVADCLPVYLFNEQKIAILHCGWRSIIKGILKNAVDILKEYRYVLGACIGACCYEIKSDVALVYDKKFPEALVKKSDKIYLDLKKVVVSELGQDRLISNLNYCTYCTPLYFYSHRRRDTERNYAVLMKNRLPPLQ